MYKHMSKHMLCISNICQNTCYAYKYGCKQRSRMQQHMRNIINTQGLCTVRSENYYSYNLFKKITCNHILYSIMSLFYLSSSYFYHCVQNLIHLFIFSSKLLMSYPFEFLNICNQFIVEFIVIFCNFKNILGS